MKLILVLVILLATGCQSLKTDTQAPAPSVDVKPIPASFELAWGHPEWTAELAKLAKNNLSDFNKAKDWARFCPKYTSLDDNGKVQAISNLVVAIAKFESGYNPKSVFAEPPPLNRDSLGLLQLSYGDRFCPKSRSEADLKDPLVNLRCGVKIMGWLIGRDSIISSVDHKGASRYWSVIREGHHVKEIAAKVASTKVCE